MAVLGGSTDNPVGDSLVDRVQHMNEGSRQPGPVQAVLLEDRSETVAEILTTIQEEEPSYARFESAHDEERWAATVEWFYELFMQLAGDHRWLTASEQEEIRDIGRQRRAQAFEFDATKSAIRASVGIVRGRIWGLYPIAAETENFDGDRLLALLERFGRALEELMQSGFASEQGTAASRPSTALLEDVVAHRLRGADSVLQRAIELGCVAVPRVLLMTPDAAGAESIASAFVRVILARRTAGRIPHTVLVVAVPEGGWSIMLEEIRELASEARTTALVTTPSADLGELYDQYVCALPLMAHLTDFAGPGEIVLDSHVEYAMVMAALPRDVREAMIRRILLRPLTSQGEEDPKEVLAHLDLNVRLGYSALAIKNATGMDKKTVYSWRNRCSQAIRRSLTDPRDQALVALACHGRRLGK